MSDENFTLLNLNISEASWQIDQILCSIIGVGERLHKVLGQIDHGTLDSGELSLPFGLLVLFDIFSNRNYGYQLLDVVLFDLITTTECFY